MKTKYTKEQLQPIIADSVCWNDVCRKLNLSPNGGSIKSFLRRIADHFSISYTHFLGKRKNKLLRTTAVQALRCNSGYNRSTIRKIVVEDELLPYNCIICGQPPMWNGKPLTLILDHINGNCRDHELKNLRFVCPNCDTQLPTYAGKNCKGIPKTLTTPKKPKRVNKFHT